MWSVVIKIKIHCIGKKLENKAKYDNNKSSPYRQCWLGGKLQKTVSQKRSLGVLKVKVAAECWRDW